MSRSTATELLRVLADPKFQLSEGEQEELLADYVMTGDKDLLSLAGEFPVPIVTADMFLTRHVTNQ